MTFERAIIIVLLGAFALFAIWFLLRLTHLA